MMKKVDNGKNIPKSGANWGFSDKEPKVEENSREVVIEKCIMDLSDENWAVRLLAARALGEAASHGVDIGEKAIMALKNALNDPHWAVVAEAYYALGEAGRNRPNIIDENFITSLKNAMDHKNWILTGIVRRRLELALQHPDWHIRARVAEAFKEVAEKGHDISPAIEALKNVADNDEYLLVREAAREALRAAGVSVE
ncbi:MAG: HEAT repeat domain-containing protein [Candidatus Anstonellales archaeon]